ncbi:MAG: hydratase [Rhodospirillaceae bacterium]|nr:hydratase [Rhodospirillaceae bacterium]
MLSDNQARAAAELIWECWHEGRTIDVLPENMRPANRNEGYAIQRHYERLSRRPIVGWKIAATSAAGQAHIGVDGPLAGRLLAERVHKSGSTIPFGHNKMAVAEPEFAFRLSRDLPPAENPYKQIEVMAAVGSLHTAIEIPNSRFNRFEEAGTAQLIADNACAHEFILGSEMPETWRYLDLAQHTVRATVEGKVTHDGVGANVLGDPCIALTWIANELSEHGIGLIAGQVITTGTCAVPLPIRQGDSVTVDYGSLGSLKVRLSS